LHFATDLPAAVRKASLIFLAVGTPQSSSGAADLSALWAVVDDIAPHLAADAIVVTKSTVPVGTNARIAARLKERTGRDCDVASNPEFLKEGTAIDDFVKPDRVVVGIRRPEVGKVLKRLYAPFLRTDHPFLEMSPESAEMTKYVANALLATKISFINEIANICERKGGDINDVRRGIGHDARIGFAFLFPGVGYGGSCFPKDIRQLGATAREVGVEPRILDAIDAVNVQQKEVLLKKILEHFGGKLAGLRLGVWGLAFKPRTDDIREAPSLSLITGLLERGCSVNAHDPEAMPNVRAFYGQSPLAARLTFSDTPIEAIQGADALAIVTEWAEFRNPDFDAMRQSMKQPVIFDGRNLYDPDQMQAAQFAYYSIGRVTVRGA
jgi:UDPglucose 6-dehydrogenase